MIRTAMGTIQIQETDVAGTHTKTYVLSTSQATSRLDLIPSTSQSEKRYVATASTHSFITTHIAPLFLPNGYPHTVTPDYTPYQVYDSLQAFTSSIAGLLSSRAVLQSLGMDTEGSGTSTATYATLLSIARSTISNLSTILFADYMSSRISGEVKFYRYLADIMNDAGFLLEMVSPSLPDHSKVPSLCLSSALRAMCGVAGGSSKAILSIHFAVDGNIGELNAKDGSQETLVNLLGMWVGGLVVSKVEGLWATWCWMIVLLGLHLWFNWLAVTSVRLRGLNLSRSGTIFRTLIEEDKCEGVETVGRSERVFETSGAVRNNYGTLMMTGEIGVGIGLFVKSIGGRKQAGSKVEVLQTNILQQLIDIFAEEQYLLWVVMPEKKAVIALKEGASRDDQLKAWCHAVRISCQLRGETKSELQIRQMISNTLSINNSAWQGFRGRIEETGWDMTATALESTPGTRLKLLTSQPSGGNQYS